MSTEPLLNRANIVTLISGLSALLVHTNGGTVSDWLNVNADAVAAVILLVAPLFTALLARRHVTPVVAPRAADGTPLVPAGSVAAVASAVEAPAIDAAAVLAAAEAIHPMTTA